MAYYAAVGRGRGLAVAGRADAAGHGSALRRYQWDPRVLEWAEGADGVPDLAPGLHEHCDRYGYDRGVRLRLADHPHAALLLARRGLSRAGWGPSAPLAVYIDECQDWVFLYCADCAADALDALDSLLAGLEDQSGARFAPRVRVRVRAPPRGAVGRWRRGTDSRRRHAEDRGAPPFGSGRASAD